MNLLLDANLSWRLADALVPHFDDVSHVDLLFASYPPSDIEIWNKALLTDSIIVTNDHDFLNLMMQKGFPPKIILLRSGNQSTQFIRQLLLDHIQDIHALHQSNEYGLLELF